MKMNVTIAATLLALWPLAQAEVPRDNGKPGGAVRSVSELKALHTAMLAQIKTVVLEEKVVELRKGLPNEDEERRAAMTDAFIRVHAQAVADQALGVKQTAELDAQLEERLASMEGTVIVARLNGALAFARRTTIDVVVGALRYDTRDLRDVDRLGIENGLSELDLISLDMTGSRIMKRDACVDLVARAQKIAVVSRHPVYRFDQHAYKLGLLPAWVFSSGLQLKLSELVPTVSEELQLVGRRDDGVIRFVATLSADVGYRVTDFKIFNDGKPFRQFSMSNFRKVGDILIPYRTVRSLDTEVPERLVERREVRSASVNAPVASDAFTTPAGYRVQELGGAGRD